MEQNSTFDNFELQFTETAKGFLKETAKWAYFLSIIGFIGVGFLVVFALAIGTMMGAASSFGNSFAAFGAMGATFITVLYLVMAILYFFPVYFLNRFASNLKAAFRDNDTVLLTKSLEFLKSHYKFLGISTIVFIGFYLLAIFGSVVMALV